MFQESNWSELKKLIGDAKLYLSEVWTETGKIKLTQNLIDGGKEFFQTKLKFKKKIQPNIKFDEQSYYIRQWSNL